MSIRHVYILTSGLRTSCSSRRHTREDIALRAGESTDKPVRIRFVADEKIIDQIVDWFGLDISITEHGEGQVMVTVKSSPNAMEYWALQYINFVEAVSPEDLRGRIKYDLEAALKKYG